MSEIIVRISDDGKCVEITDGNGKPLEAEEVGSGPIVIDRHVGILDRLTWYSGSPLCVWHDGKRYCAG